MTDYDKLTLEIWTDGTISPSDALSTAAGILLDHVEIFINPEARVEGRAELSGDEAQRVEATLWPRLCSQRFSSLRCVVLPEPSGPSKAINSPRCLSRRLISCWIAAGRAFNDSRRCLNRVWHQWCR